MSACRPASLVEVAAQSPEKSPQFPVGMELSV
jgi:hypothetical protein